MAKDPDHRPANAETAEARLTELWEAGFRGRGVAPMTPNCYPAEDPGSAPEDGGAEGVQHYRYRDVDLGLNRKVARDNDLDAARALATALQQQSDSPEPDALRALLGEHLKMIEIPGATGELGFDERGFLEKRRFEIDRYGADRWHEEHDLTSER